MADLFDWLDSVAFPIAMDLALQSALVLLLVALAARLMRRGPAAGRHALWLGGFALLLVLPAAYVAWPKHSLVGPAAAPPAVSHLEAVAPNYLRRVEVEGEGVAKTGSPDRGVPEDSRAVESAGDSAAADASRPSAAAALPQGSGSSTSSTPTTALGWRSALVALWALGAVFALTRLVLGRVRLARWIRRSRPAAPALREVARRAAARIGRRAPAIRVSKELRAPALAGVLRPVVLLPEELAENAEARLIEPILLHEMTHAERRDPLAQLLCEVATALFWFQPLAWLGRAELGRDREIVTDARVVALLERRSDYAEGILRVVGAVSGRPTAPSFALGVADGGAREIEERLEVILAGGGRAWSRPGRVARIAAVVGIVALGAAAMSTSLRAEPARPSEIRPDSGPVETEVAPTPREEVAKDDAIILIVDLKDPESFVFEGESLDLAGLRKVLERYGVARPEMRRPGNPLLSRARLHLRIDAKRTFFSLERVMRLAARPEIAIAEIDLALVGRPETRVEIALPTDFGLLDGPPPALPVKIERGKGQGLARFRVADRKESAELSPAAAAQLVTTKLAATEGAVLTLGLDRMLPCGTLVEFLGYLPGGTRRVVGVTIGEPAGGIFEEETEEEPEEDPVGPLPGPKEVAQAMNEGLEYLARIQRDDGSISAEESKYDAIVLGRTALATLAFLGAGETHQVGPHKAVVAKALRRLAAETSEDGCFVTSRSVHRNYGHALATLALAEAYAMTKDEKLRPHVEKGVAFILKAQNPYRGWRYGIADGDNDSAMTSWMLMALVAARNGGVEVGDRAFEWGYEFLQEMTDADTGRIGYNRKGGPPVREQGMAERFPAELSESLTAAGLVAGHLSRPSDREVPRTREASFRLLGRKLPRWDPEAGRCDFYYWYWGSAASRLAGDPLATRWREAIARALVPNRVREGDNRGSWDPVGPWGGVGGRVYTTALCVLSLETVSFGK